MSTTPQHGYEELKRISNEELSWDYYLFLILLSSHSYYWRWTNYGHLALRDNSSYTPQISSYIDFKNRVAPVELGINSSNAIHNIPDNVDRVWLKTIHDYLADNIDVLPSLFPKVRTVYINSLEKIKSKLFANDNDNMIIWVDSEKEINTYHTMYRSRSFSLLNSAYIMSDIIYQYYLYGDIQNGKRLLFNYKGDTTELKDIIEFTSKYPELEQIHEIAVTWKKEHEEGIISW